MDELQADGPAVVINGATLPLVAVLHPGVVRIELHSASGDVVLVTRATRIRCPADRIAYGETGDGQPFRAVAGTLYLDAADRQRIPISIV